MRIEVPDIVAGDRKQQRHAALSGRDLGRGLAADAAIDDRPRWIEEAGGDGWEGGVAG
jgi:hypothetical protein